jgi:hypothetical protein
MTNNEIRAFFVTQMTAMLTAQGHPEIDVVSSFQPDSQGRLDGPVLYFAEAGDVPNGAQGFTTQHNPLTGSTIDTSVQRWRITFQVQGFAPVDKTDLGKLTAQDITKLALMLVNSPRFRAALKANNMGLEKIPATKPNFVVNDRAQYEAGPSFEFTMSYKRTIIQQSAIITTADIAIHRV